MLRKWVGFLLFGIAARLHAAPFPFDINQIQAPHDIREITMNRSGDFVEVIISATHSVSFSGRLLPQGMRFYVDFSDCRLAVGSPVLEMSRDGVRVRAAQFSVDPPIVRVVVQSGNGEAPSLGGFSPSSRTLIRVPALSSPAEKTQIRVSTAPGYAPPAPERVQTAPRRSILASRGVVSRSISETYRMVAPAPSNGVDLGDAFEDPPVPSEGDLLLNLLVSPLPSALMGGVEAALEGPRRYSWGGTTPDGFDCSGMMQFIFRHAGIYLPRTSREQAKVGEPVEMSDLRPGDLVFFSRSGRVFHVGMYIGSGSFFHASNPKRGLATDQLSRSFYQKHYAGARRVLSNSG